MEELASLIGIAAALFIGAASPGPSFLMVARTSLSVSRSGGFYAALGMGVGGLFFAVASFLGLQGLLQAIPSLYFLLKITGGLYLAFLGVKIWLSAKQPLFMNQAGSALLKQSPWQSFLLGLLTQISNPKAVIVYTGIFAVFLPSSPSLVFGLCTVAIAFFVETLWYTIVAVVLSSKRPRKVYLNGKAWVDRIAGGVLAILGVKLASSYE